MKKTTLLRTLFIFTLAMIILAGFTYKTSIKNRPADSKGFALVELFTSEGCSSCPPADELLSKISAAATPNVYVLAYHVDYWNRLGWKDSFSDEKYTLRQQQYASALNLQSIYTPQAVINGQWHCTGSDEHAIKEAINRGLHLVTTSSLALKLVHTDQASVQVAYEVKGTTSDQSVIQLAVVQLTATTAVHAGENNGLVLHHVRLVRSFKTVAAGAGNATLSLPKECKAGSYTIVGFLQSNKTRQVTAVAEINPIGL